MIRMTKQADYAIVLLTHVASGRAGVVHAAREVAGQTHLKLPMVGKILKALARGGLLESQRGAHGGYRLARPAGTITLADVLEVMDGPLSMTECLGSTPSCCDHESECRVKHHWRSINEAVARALSRVTLAEMVAPRPVLVTLDVGRRAGSTG